MRSLSGKRWSRPNQIFFGKIHRLLWCRYRLCILWGSLSLRCQSFAHTSRRSPHGETVHWKGSQKRTWGNNLHPSQSTTGGVGNWWENFGRCCAPAMHGVQTEGEEVSRAEDGPLTWPQVRPYPIFQSMVVDLFSPIEYCGTVSKRQTRRGWGFMFVCMATSRVHVKFVYTYSTPWTDSSWPSGPGSSLTEGTSWFQPKPDKGMGLKRNPAVGRQEGDRTASSSYGRTALQRASQKNDRDCEETASQEPWGQKIYLWGNMHPLWLINKMNIEEVEKVFQTFFQWKKIKNLLIPFGWIFLLSRYL
jgi:hypothetical protein